MRRRMQDLTKLATKLLADYGNDAETEAAERAELLYAIGSHDEAEDWIEIMAQVAGLRQQADGARAA